MAVVPSAYPNNLTMRQVQITALERNRDEPPRMIVWCSKVVAPDPVVKPQREHTEVDQPSVGEGALGPTEWTTPFHEGTAMRWLGHDLTLTHKKPPVKRPRVSEIGGTPRLSP